MAQSFSENQLNQARKNFYGKLYFTKEKPNLIMVIINKILIYFLFSKIFFLNLKRYFFRFYLILKKKKINNFFISVNLNENEKKYYSQELSENSYVFIKNFFDENSYNILKKNWPDINFFNHNNKIIKYYSVGLRSINCKIKKEDILNLSSNQELKQFYDYISSNEFNKFVNDILQFENQEFQNYSILSTMAGNNSYLVPHIDGVKSLLKKAYNFIYFVDGNDQNVSLSGATGIYKDNEFNKPLLIPSTLKNSLLIYKSTENFYHGFPLTKMPKNCFRKTINFQFL